MSHSISRRGNSTMSGSGQGSADCEMMEDSSPVEFVSDLRSLLRQCMHQTEESLKKSNEATIKSVDELFRNHQGSEEPSRAQSSCQNCDALKQKLSEMETFKKERAKERAVWDNKKKEMEKEILDLKNRKSTWMPGLTPKRAQSPCRNCDAQKQQVSDMETFINKQTKERSALENMMKEMEKELKGLRDRMGAIVSAGRKPDNVDDMDSPVNQSRLQDMYNELRLRKWNDYLEEFKKKHESPVEKEQIKAWFEKAAKDMEILIVGDARDESSQVQKFRQKALENLQLTLFHSSDRRRKQIFQTLFPQFQKAPAALGFGSQCYWLGCLMALNSPPLHPSWDSKTFSKNNPFPEFKFTSQRS